MPGFQATHILNVTDSVNCNEHEGKHRYFATLAYNGAPFHGWQVQPNDISVQQVLEEALSKLLRQPTAVIGAGRTDAGVHARKMIAHFDSPAALDTSETARRLNAMTGPDIAIYNIQPVTAEAHARFDATKRTYHYMIHHVKSPFLQGQSWFCPKMLDYDRMNGVAQHLIGTHDFTSFAKLHSDARTNICTVTEARWIKVGQAEEQRWEFIISADRFLRNMVRAVVGTLVDVGRGKMTEAEFMNTIELRNRCAAGTSMPAHALYLWDVEYPAELFN